MKLREKEVEVGYLYFTGANQYRAVLAMKGEFMIYAPSLEGIASLNLKISPSRSARLLPSRKRIIRYSISMVYQQLNIN